MVSFHILICNLLRCNCVVLPTPNIVFILWLFYLQNYVLKTFLMYVSTTNNFFKPPLLIYSFGSIQKFGCSMEKHVYSQPSNFISLRVLSNERSWHFFKPTSNWDSNTKWFQISYQHLQTTWNLNNILNIHLSHLFKVSTILMVTIRRYQFQKN
jgi:hypothetical protein